MNRKKIIFITAVLIFIVNFTFADFFNNRNILVGERAAMMGGAYTALSEDNSGAYYNPAGLAFIKHFSLSMTANVYSYKYLNRYDGNDGKVVKLRAFELVPTSFGFNISLGKVVLGFSIFQTDKFLFSSITIKNDLAFKLDIETQTFLMGPSIAFRLTDSIAIGASFFYHYFNGKFTNIGEKDPATDSTIEQNQIISGGFTSHIGIKWSLTTELKWGLNYGSQTVNIHGNNAFSYINLPSATPTTDRGEHAGDIRFPHRVSMGLAYEKKGVFTLSLDGIYYFKMRYDSPNHMLATRYSDYEYKEESHIDVSVGGEFFMNESLSLRLGFFTNTSSAPNRHETEKVHQYGGTFGLGYHSDGLSSGIGFSVAYGQTGWQSSSIGGSGAKWKRLTVSLIVGGSMKF